MDCCSVEIHKLAPFACNDSCFHRLSIHIDELGNTDVKFDRMRWVNIFSPADLHIDISIARHVFRGNFQRDDMYHTFMLEKIEQKLKEVV